MRLTEVYPVGQKVEIGTVHFAAEDIVRFAQRFDPQVFHVDAEAAKQSLFGGLCASGWHTCAGWMRSYVSFFDAEEKRLRAEGKEPPKMGPSPGFKKLSWLRPVFAGDTITYSVTPLGHRTLASRPGWIMNQVLCEGVNQRGEPVVSFESAIVEFA